MKGMSSPQVKIALFVLKSSLMLLPRKFRVDAVKYIPGEFGDYVRRYVFGRAMKRFGRGSYISDGVVVRYPENIEIGEDVSVNSTCVLHGMGGIKIGSKSRIAYGAKLISFEHRFADRNTAIKDQGYDCGPIEIGEDVWIGAQAVILRGVRIGKGSVIGANSLVNSDIPPYSIAVGSPAKVIRKR